MELKNVIGPESDAELRGRLISSNTAVSAYDYLRMNTGGIMSTDHLDIHDTNNQYGIICKTGPGMMGNIAARMWGGGVQIKRDDSSSARWPRRARSTSTRRRSPTSRFCGLQASRCST